MWTACSPVNHRRSDRGRVTCTSRPSFSPGRSARAQADEQTGSGWSPAARRDVRPAESVRSTSLSARRDPMTTTPALSLLRRHPARGLRSAGPSVRRTRSHAGSRPRSGHAPYSAGCSSGRAAEKTHYGLPDEPARASVTARSRDPHWSRHMWTWRRRSAIPLASSVSTVVPRRDIARPGGESGDATSIGG